MAFPERKGKKISGPGGGRWRLLGRRESNVGGNVESEAGVALKRCGRDRAVGVVGYDGRGDG